MTNEATGTIAAGSGISLGGVTTGYDLGSGLTITNTGISPSSANYALAVSANNLTTGGSLAVVGSLGAAGMIVGVDGNGAPVPLGGTIRAGNSTDPNSQFGGTLVLQGGLSGGTNHIGGNVILSGGQSTGNAAGGSIIFETSPASSTSGFTLNSTTTQMVITGSGNVGIGTTSPSSLLTVWGPDTSATTLPFQVVNSASTTLLDATDAGNVGIGTTSPYAQLSIFAGGTYASQAASTLFAIGSTTAGTATTTLFSVSNIGSTTIGNFGTCSGSNALNTSAGTIVCGAISGFDTFAWPFTVNTGYVSTTTNIGIFASTTIGAGTQITGLTISGGATTTANAYFGGTVAIGSTSPFAMLSVNPIAGQASAAFDVGSSTSFQNNINFVIGNNGDISSGTSSPFALLSLMNNASSSNTTLFAIGSSTNAGGVFSTTTLFSISNSGIFNYGVNSTSTILNNTQYAWTIATSTTAEPLLAFTTITGSEQVSLGVPGSDIIIGDTNSSPNVVFQNSGTIEGAGAGQTITIGNGGDIINFGVNTGIGSTSPFAMLSVNPIAGQAKAAFDVGSSTSFQNNINFVIGNNGDISSGTSSPFALLSLMNNASSSNTTLFAIGSSTNAGGVFSTTTLLEFTNQGLLGIGSTSPFAMLSVNPIAGQAKAAFDVGSSTSFQNNINFVIGNNGDISSGTSSPFALLSLMNNASSSNTTLFAIGSSTNAGGVFSTTTLLEFTNQGLLGIGSTSPFAMLSVNPIAGQASAAFDVGSSTSFQNNINFVIGNNGDISSGTSSPFALLSLMNNASSSNTTLFAIGSSTNAGGVFSTTTLLEFTNQGLLGIGSTSPFAMLSVNPIAGQASAAFDVGSSTSFQNNINFVIGNNGDISSGTSSPFALLSLMNNASSSNTTLFAIGSSTNAGGVFSTTTLFSISNQGLFNYPTFATTTVDNVQNGWSISTTSTFVAGTQPVESISTNGATTTVGFFVGTSTGLTAGSGVSLGPEYKNTVIIGNGKVDASVMISNGTLCVSAAGSCASVGTTSGVIIARSYTTISTEDLAEMYQSNVPLFPGNLVAVATSSDTITLADSSVEETLIGAVSTNPGITFGDGDTNTNEYPIALAGQIPVLVTLDNGPINPGDRIALSTTTPGYGMKAGPFDPSVGVALESYTAASSSNSILVFMNDQQGVNIPTLQQILLGSSTTATTTLTATSTLTGTDFAGTIMQVILSRLSNFGIDITQAMTHIENLFADTLTVGSASEPAGITLYDQETKAPYCVSMQNGQMVSTAGTCQVPTGSPQIIGGSDTSTSGSSGSEDSSNASSTNSTSSSDSSENTSTPTVPPTITINGNDPATISVGSTYEDLGATVSDTGPGQAGDTNLGYQTLLNGNPVTSVNLDTSTSTTYSIAYVATDSSGLTATSTRTVDVQ